MNDTSPHDRIPEVELALQVAATLGLDACEASVLRRGSNTLVRLRPCNLVARIPADVGALRETPVAWLEREVALSTFLSSNGAAVVRPAEGVPPGPHQVDSTFVTLWEYVAQSRIVAKDGRFVGQALRRIHEVLESYEGSLPHFVLGADFLMVIAELKNSLERLGSVPVKAHDIKELMGHYDKALSSLEGVPIATQALHGDASVSNVLWSVNGPVWNDFEDACKGPVEWELARLETTISSKPLEFRLAREALVGYGERDEALLSLLVDLRGVQLVAWSLYAYLQNPSRLNKARRRLRWWTRRVESQTRSRSIP